MSNAPPPTEGTLRLIVHLPTRQYNTPMRLGRSFSLEVLAAVSFFPPFEPSICTSVDIRCKNPSVVAMQVNVQRLKEYRAKLLPFPQNPAKLPCGKMNNEQLVRKEQLTETLVPVVGATSTVEVHFIRKSN